MFISFFFATLLFFMVLALFLGAPLVPSKKVTSEAMIRLLNIKHGEIIYDLGSGDGRLLTLIAQKGATAIGIEINPYAILIGWMRALVTGNIFNIKIIWGNYWWVNIAKADKVIVYGLPHIMPKLVKKFKAELRPKTKIISNSFQIPGLIKIKEEKVGKDWIYLYQV